MGSTLSKVTRKVFTSPGDSKSKTVNDIDYTPEKSSSNSDESSDFTESEETSEDDLNSLSDKSEPPECSVPTSEDDNQIDDNDNTPYSWEELRSHPLLEKNNVSSENNKQIHDDVELHKESDAKSFNGDPSTSEILLDQFNDETIEISGSDNSYTEKSPRIETVHFKSFLEEGKDINGTNQIQNKTFAIRGAEDDSTKEELQFVSQSSYKQTNSHMNTGENYEEISYQFWEPSTFYTTHNIKKTVTNTFMDCRPTPTFNYKSDNSKSFPYDSSRISNDGNGNNTKTNSIRGAKETNKGYINSHRITELRSPKRENNAKWRNKKSSSRRSKAHDVNSVDIDRPLVDRQPVEKTPINNEATVIKTQSKEKITSHYPTSEGKQIRQESENNYNNNHLMKQSTLQSTKFYDDFYMEDKHFDQNIHSQYPNTKDIPKYEMLRKDDSQNELPEQNYTNNYPNLRDMNSAAHNRKKKFPKYQPLKDGDGFIMYGKNLTQPSNNPANNEREPAVMNSVYPIYNPYSNQYRHDRNYYMSHQQYNRDGNRAYREYNQRYDKDPRMYHEYPRDDFKMYHNQPHHLDGPSVGENVPHYRYQPPARDPGYNWPPHPNKCYVNYRRYIPQKPSPQHYKYEDGDNLVDSY